MKPVKLDGQTNICNLHIYRKTLNMKLEEIYTALSEEKIKVIDKYGVSGKVISFGGNFRGTFVSIELDSGKCVTMNVHDFEMENCSLESLRKSLEIFSKGV